MAEEIFGIIGLIMLLVGWLSEAFQTIRDRKADVPIAFACLYFVASALLVYHAFLINDVIFLVLNTATALVALLNIYYFFRAKMPERNKRAKAGRTHRKRAARLKRKR